MVGEGIERGPEVCAASTIPHDRVPMGTEGKERRRSSLSLVDEC